MNPEVSRRLARALSLLPPFYEADYQRLINEAAFVESFEALSSYAKNYILKAETKLADRNNVKKHLPGKHDQASHGKGGAKIASFTPKETLEFIEGLDFGGRTGNDAYRFAYQKLAEKMGRTGNPTVGELTDKEKEISFRVFSEDFAFDAAERESGRAMGTPEDKIEMFLHGDSPYMASGGAGFGLYVSPSLDNNETWTLIERMDGLRTGASQKTIRLGLTSDAKVYNVKARDESWFSKDKIYRDVASADLNYPNLTASLTAGRWDPIDQLFTLSVFAQGYDAITGWDDQSIFMTPSKIVVDTNSLPSGVTKHRSGEHDQSTHGRKGGLGVPDYVDIEGKRYSAEAVSEFVSRKRAYETGLSTKIDSISNDIAIQRYGKPYDQLNESEERDVNSHRFVDGKWTDQATSGSADWYDKPDIRTMAKADNEVLSLKKEVEEHYLMKDAMAQKAWNEDGTLGPKTIGEISHRGETAPDFVSRYIENQDRVTYDDDSTDYTKATSVARRDANGEYIRDANGRQTYETVLVSKKEAEQIHAEEWKAFGDAAYPEVIVSNKGLRSILADGEFKTYTEVDRPARAGANDAEYKNARAAYESVAFGYDNDVDTENRPVSGLLTAFDPHGDLLKGYGNTQVILKPSVLARSTVTRDDSLNGFYRPQTVASFLSKPSYGFQNKPVASDVRVNGRGYYTDRKRGIYNTPEIQIHGKVRTSDIARVIFRDTVPAALSTKLDGLGIPYEVRTITGGGDGGES